ncbi:toll-like receptor 6 [Anoplophora glabripennis]|uniref:toll-like receptor 6 n=1 Tax=Anoplophora glabripennis TaxID=217634 RepID=UPI00087521F5|nr:toll-like receptor 6 [Anoplophora glabripennis]
MASKEIFTFMVYLASWIVHCSGGCVETAEVVYEENDPNYDEYYDNRQQTEHVNSISVDCSSVNLSYGRLSSDAPKNYQCSQCPQKLTIRNSIVPTIPPSAFTNYPSTTILDITSNEVETILPGAFNLLKALQELYLSNNNITSISDGIFNSLVNLIALDLSKNNIQKLSSHSFHGCNNLHYINLSQNALQSFDSYSLVNIKEHAKLDLSFNKLEIFNFTSLSHMHTLILSNNNISSIIGCFAPLLVLDISKNSLSSLARNNCNDSNPGIYFLDASHNSLSNLETTPALKNISHLFLQNNNIASIPNDYFSNLNGLVLLNLSTNELEKLQYGLFDGLMKLQVLHLSKNHLTSFKSYNYHLLNNLHELYLHENEISIFDSKDFKELLTQLEELSLDGNNFTCDKLTEIFHDLRGIKIYPGHSWSSSNIHGIACSETDYNSEVTTKQNFDIEEAFRTKLNEILNIDFTKSSLYKYYNKDFRKSNFYKYLENLQFNNSINIYDVEKKLNDTDIAEFPNHIVNDYFHSSFRNSNFVKYFVNYEGTENVNSDKIDMDNYFNKDFLSSSFYKKLETFKSPVFEINYTNQENGAEMEKLINTFVKAEKKEDNSVLLLIIIFVLVVTACIMLYIMYINHIKFEKILNKNMNSN